MVMAEFGHKCVCVGCAARFYDLTRLPAICPKCHTAQPPPKARVSLAPRGALRNRHPVPAASVIPAEAEADADLAGEPEEDEADEVAEDTPEAEDRAAEEV